MNKDEFTVGKFPFRGTSLTISELIDHPNSKFTSRQEIAENSERFGKTNIEDFNDLVIGDYQEYNEKTMYFIDRNGKYDTKYFRRYRGEDDEVNIYDSAEKDVI